MKLNVKLKFKKLRQVGPLVALLFLCSCNKEVQKNLSPKELAKKALIAQGKTVYVANCIACHNLDPKLPGSTGPDVYGSSLELLTLRVLKLEYPKGYKPKRDTELMASFLELEKDIPSLYEFLNN